MKRYAVLSILSCIFELIFFVGTILIAYYLFYQLNQHYLHIQPLVRLVAIFNLCCIAPIVFLWSKFLDKFKTKDCIWITIYICGIIAIINFTIS